MKRKLSMGSLLIAGALTGFTGQTGASMQSNPDGGTGEIMKSQWPGRRQLVQRDFGRSRNSPGPDRNNRAQWLSGPRRSWAIR